MYEMSCEMCMDLMPLVRDGVSSEDTQNAVMHHIHSCDACRALYEGDTVPQGNADKALLKAVKRVQSISKAVVIAVILVGIFLCEMVMQGSSMLLVLVVLIIRCLLRVTFSEEKGKVIKKTVALLVSVALAWGILWAGNEIFGNPITKAQAENHIQGYMEGAFGDSDYYIEKIRYTWSRSYEADVRSASDPELEFYISYWDGRIIYDTYKEHVLDIWE